MYYVFVDFDGVLTSWRVHFGQQKNSYPIWSTFDPIAIQFFNKIHDTFEDVRFVWTTSWRNGLEESGHIQHIVYSMWYNAGFRGIFADPWRVNQENNPDLYNYRAEEIKQYLEKYPCDDYLIFDDTDYRFNDVLGKKRFIRTDPSNGLLFKHMKDAWSKMGTWKKK